MLRSNRRRPGHLLPGKKFHRHGYPLSFINPILRRTEKDLQLKARALPSPPNPSPLPAPVRLSVPFAGPCFYQLKREANKIGIQLVSKPSQTIGTLLCSQAKHRLPKQQESNVIYCIECSCRVEGPASPVFSMSQKVTAMDRFMAALNADQHSSIGFRGAL
ncbi:hypothetical protein FJT64_011150 [Amphibalanus amphitrite]|uniref:Uncharacterized protein n=1 Tax=Amphibalanus amphitrite TaxID=1232801 RepID=A0A6A4VAJ1_AMPAM|nr:hypothetical protein FJT64_011150 [Amphibalanus amphitrite]